MSEQDEQYKRLESYADVGWEAFIKVVPKEMQPSEKGMDYAKRFFKLGFISCMLGTAIIMKREEEANAKKESDCNKEEVKEG